MKIAPSRTPFIAYPPLARLLFDVYIRFREVLISSALGARIVMSMLVGLEELDANLKSSATTTPSILSAVPGLSPLVYSPSRKTFAGPALASNRRSPA